MYDKTYSELITFDTYNDRLSYLRLRSKVGYETFGHERWVNQQFYTSNIWIELRSKIIVRDFGCDLGVHGEDIANKRIIIHHINPIDIDDIINRTNKLLDPNNLITTTKVTHDLIHYGTDLSMMSLPIERYPDDMIPWKSN